MQEVYSEEQVSSIAQKIFIYMNENNSHILTLSGDLGAGKTTLVKAIAFLFGVKETIQSPTFTVLKAYSIEDSRYSHFVHVDAYRILDESELVPLHFSDYLTENHFVCIEWPEHISHMINSVPHTHVQIQYSNDNRTITIYEKK